MAVKKPVGDNAQGRREEALAAQDQSDGQRHLDEAQQGNGRVPGPEEGACQKAV